MKLGLKAAIMINKVSVRNPYACLAATSTPDQCKVRRDT